MLLGLYASIAAGLLLQVVLGQDGSITGPQSSAEAAGYSCDASKCQLPNCNCASTSPPGGLNGSDVPQFIVFTADDAVQSYTIDAVNQLLAQRKNPNGCPLKMTYYTSLNYTNYTLVTDWFVAGNEIADHTMTHQGDPSQAEINGNLIALNSLAGIPMSAIIGFRAPYLNYTPDTFTRLKAAGFTYDSSASSSLPVDADGTDAYWPYTLDYGLANDCLTVEGVCQGQPQVPGLWEVPMYAFFDQRGVDGIHLMDNYLDPCNGNSVVDDNATLEYMKDTFTKHYNGNRQPIGLYTHPIHLATNYPGVPAPTSTINMLNSFLDWAQEQPNVWIVSTAQLLAWVRDPKSVADLNSSDALKCSTPQVDPSKQICNGIPQNENGLLNHCAFSDFPFYTCYGCPVETPTADNPNPAQSVPAGGQARYRLPANCTTAFWDPVAGNCLCQDSSCQFSDESRPIGPNGANLTGGGTGGALQSGSATPSFEAFNGADPSPLFSTGAKHALVVGLIGAVIGAAEVIGRL
ncbi:hypothetical protein GYMLUDRAFT_254679 [Collybiopsis luxurians FD-317 M1]|nr:hypothetical protein GYMLUDRAFT_254679 [Collybiopsis luxurians FD-317 M1]